MIITINDLKFGDILTYRMCGKHCVNKPNNYVNYYKKDLTHISKNKLDIIKIQRYKKLLFGYKLITIYESKGE